MISLPASVIPEINSLVNTGSLLVLVEIQFTSDTIYLCKNNDFVYWSGINSHTGLDIDEILFQTGNTIRYTFNGAPDLSTVNNYDRLTVASASYSKNNGSFLITGVNNVAKYIEVTNTTRAGDSEDESSDSPATGIIQNNNTWTPFPFDLGNLPEAKPGEVPSVQLTVSNAGRSIQRIIEEYDGGVDATVILRVVHSKHLNETTEIVRLDFLITDTTADSHSVVFTLGTNNVWNARFPLHIMTKNTCRWKFKSSECGVSSSVYPLHLLYNTLTSNPTLGTGVTGLTSGSTGTISSFIKSDIRSNAGDYYYMTLIISSPSDDFIVGEDIRVASVALDAPCIGWNTCDRTVDACRRFSNSARFGGFPGIGRGGLKV